MKTIGDACEFLFEWRGIEEDLAGPPLGDDQPYPECVDALNRRLGRLWRDRSHPLYGLLQVQDKIIDPLEYKSTAEGVIPAIWENQGVWGFGFRPNTTGLLACRYWPVLSQIDSDWQPVDATLEDALIQVLLSNFCLAFYNEGDGLPGSSKPDDANTLPWMHRAWNGFWTFDGFWTNTQRTVLHYGGMGFTARRKA